MNKRGNGKNVIWILADQLRADAISINGDPNVNTPNLHNLASQGVNFTNAVSGSPLCCPNRGCLMTGQYANESSVPGHEYQLDTNKNTIADAFNENGYDTLYFGKWHLDGYEESKGRAGKHIIPKERRGRFNTWIGYENNNSQFDCYVHGHDKEKEIGLYRLPKFETDALTDLAIDKIDEFGKMKKEDNNKPFFMVLSVQPPHDPYIAPEEFIKNYSNKELKLKGNVPNYDKVRKQVRNDLIGYYALIENLDWNVGRVLKSLRENELDLDTHVIFFSDHGDMHGSHGQFRKTNPYEESIRIPFIIGGEKPYDYDSRSFGNVDAVINHVDITATTLGLCELDIPKWIHGHNYAHYRLNYLNKQEDPDSAYIQIVKETGHPDSIDKPWRGVVTKDGWKYVCFQNSEWLMFNLNDDPLELINLAHNSQFHEKRLELHQKLYEWIQKTNDSFELPQICS